MQWAVCFGGIGLGMAMLNMGMEIQGVIWLALSCYALTLPA